MLLTTEDARSDLIPNSKTAGSGKERKEIAANFARQRLKLQGAIRIGRSINVLVHPAETIKSQSTMELYARLLKQPKKDIGNL